MLLEGSRLRRVRPFNFFQRFSASCDISGSASQWQAGGTALYWQLCIGFHRLGHPTLRICLLLSILLWIQATVCSPVVVLFGCGGRVPGDFLYFLEVRQCTKRCILAKD